MKELGIYLHIPFCKKKCSYCDFLSFPLQEEIQKEYVEVLKKEIRAQASVHDMLDYEVTTIYIGGGTPSILSANDITDLLETIYECYHIQQEVETTVEVNPGTVTKEKLEIYQKSGVNRISIGLQSTVDERLQQIGRIHTYEQFIKTYEWCTQVGITNCNIDLMIGLPNQTQEELQHSLEMITKLNPNHISVYSLILEEGTLLEKQVRKGIYTLPDDIQERNMYWQVKRTLEQKGYNHYEISNFAKKGYESKHNLNCWEQKEYLGFGLGAHSYFQDTRYSNIEQMREYIKNMQKDQIENNKIIHEEQTQEEQEKEYMLLGFRKIQGLNRHSFQEKFQQDPLDLFYLQ